MKRFVYSAYVFVLLILNFIPTLPTLFLNYDLKYDIQDFYQSFFTGGIKLTNFDSTGMLCTQAIQEQYYGFPVPFLQFFGSNGCGGNWYFSPLLMVPDLILLFLPFLIRFLVLKINRSKQQSQY